MDENTSLITTIITTYKRPQLLKRALSSVLDQTYPHFIVYIYDNASGDETEEVVRGFMKRDSRVKYHCHSKNIGMMANYAFAMSEVKTPYFSLLSDDDLIFPCFFEVTLKGLEDFSETAFSASSAMIMSEKGEVIRVPLDLWPKEGYFPSPEGLIEMISKYPIPTCILFRRKVIEEIPIDRSNPLTWDCDFLLHVAARYPIFISKQPCGIFLHHDSSFSNAQDFSQWHKSLVRMGERLSGLKSLSAETKNLVSNLMGCDLRACARAHVLQALFHKRFKEASNYLELFLKSYGFCWQSLIFLMLIRICNWFPLTVKVLHLIRKVKRTRAHRLYDPICKLEKKI